MKITDKHGAVWQLVPVEPTEEMLEAPAKPNFISESDSWLAMISASPEPELPEGLEPVAWLPDDAIAKLQSGEPKIVLTGVPCYKYDGENTSAIVLQSAALAALAEKDAELAALRGLIHTNTDREVTMSKRFFSVHKDGFVEDNNFDFDAGLQVTGDFIDDEKQKYAEMICKVLNGHNELRSQVQRQAALIEKCHDALVTSQSILAEVALTGLLNRQPALSEIKAFVKAIKPETPAYKVVAAIEAIEKEQNHFRDATKKEPK